MGRAGVCFREVNISIYLNGDSQIRSLIGDQFHYPLAKLLGAHIFGLLFAPSADVHLSGFGFFVAYDEHEGNFLHRVLADFRVHLFVARIDFDPN